MTDDRTYYRAHRRDKQRLRREAARAAGLCLACCKRQPLQGWKSCSACLERRGRKAISLVGFDDVLDQAAGQAGRS